MSCIQHAKGAGWAARDALADGGWHETVLRTLKVQKRAAQRVELKRDIDTGDLVEPMREHLGLHARDRILHLTQKERRCVWAHEDVLYNNSRRWPQEEHAA